MSFQLTLFCHFLFKVKSRQFVEMRALLFFFNFYLFIYSFLAVLGVCFWAGAFSSCGEWGPLFIAVRGPFTVGASPVAEHRFQTRRLSSCGSRAQLLRGMWNLPRPGLEPVSPALVGRFLTTAPPGKPRHYIFKEQRSSMLRGSWKLQSLETAQKSCYYHFWV